MYEVVGRVAATRSGAVWKARDTTLGRLVALKEVGSHAAATEASALASLSSAHVVQVFDVADDGDRAYLVEEWIDGATLSAVLRAAGRLDAVQALGVMRGALLGLAAAHVAGLVHGDVSASNILIDAGGVPKLIDFGSAARIGERAGRGTGAFEAPEVRAGSAVTPAADVYSAAALLAMLLHGRTETAPSTRGVDGALAPVLDRALATAPGDRYRDAAEFLHALEIAAERRYGSEWWSAGLGTVAAGSAAALLTPGPGAPFTGHGAVASSPGQVGLTGVAPAVGRSTRRTVAMVGGSAAAVAVIAGVAVVLTSSGDKEPTPSAQTTTSTTSTAPNPTPPVTSTGTPSTSTPSTSTPSTSTPSTSTTSASTTPSTVGTASTLKDACTLIDASDATTIADAIGGEYQVVGAPKVTPQVLSDDSRRCDWVWKVQRNAGGGSSGPVQVYLDLERLAPNFTSGTCRPDSIGSKGEALSGIGDRAAASNVYGCALHGSLVIVISYGGAIGVNPTSRPATFAGPLRKAVARAGTG